MSFGSASGASHTGVTRLHRKTALRRQARPRLPKPPPRRSLATVRAAGADGSAARARKGVRQAAIGAGPGPDFGIDGRGALVNPPLAQMEEA